MSWRSIDFHGIVALDRRIVDQLELYLNEKETRLANEIIHILPPTSIESHAPTLPDPHATVKLAEAVNLFTKQVRSLNKKTLNQEFRSRIAIKDDINTALWEFTEVLEGCVIELFQQIKQVQIDRWHFALSKAVQDIKDLLLHRIEDLIWTIRRLETALKEYQSKFNLGNKVKQWIQHWRSQLDPALLTHLSQSEKMLKQDYDDFNGRFNEYKALNTKVEDFLQSMKNYPVLARLDLTEQNLYVDIFRLLKLHALNPSPNGELAQESVRSLKNLLSVDGVIQIFKDYYKGLRESFFNSSLELKALSRESDHSEERMNHLIEKVKEYENELQHFIQTMTQYREFVLDTNPNPYASSRWGFSERPVGPEPSKAKELLNLIYLSEELKSWYKRFLIALNKDPNLHRRREEHAHHEIDKFLHEMGQPLISQSMMHNRAERLLAQVRECDELGSKDSASITYIQHVLSKAMREDWKYHVLHSFPLFHESYAIHMGLQKKINDPVHLFRLEKIKQLFEQIEGWVRKEDVYSHVHEIELDINDMKIYLQDFLAAVQRTAKEKSFNPFLDETIEKYEIELLEYRYVFGQFFYTIMNQNDDGQQLRNQFLFVDQYFEAIENLLHELTLSWQGKDVKR